MKPHVSFMTLFCLSESNSSKVLRGTYMHGGKKVSHPVLTFKQYHRIA